MRVVRAVEARGADRATERLADPVYALVLVFAGMCVGIAATLLVFAIAARV